MPAPYGAGGCGGGLQVTSHCPSLLLQVTWYLLRSFKILGTCLIASGTAQVLHSAPAFGWIKHPFRGGLQREVQNASTGGLTPNSNPTAAVQTQFADFQN